MTIISSVCNGHNKIGFIGRNIVKIIQWNTFKIFILKWEYLILTVAYAMLAIAKKRYNDWHINTPFCCQNGCDNTVIISSAYNTHNKIKFIRKNVVKFAQ